MHDQRDPSTWPNGQVALVFTDVERSTELWQIDEEAFGQALTEHDQVVRDCLAAHGGVEVKHTGDGFFLVFAQLVPAAEFSLDLETRLAGHPWPAELGMVRSRIGLHWGRARLQGTDYRGPAVNLASRICNASSGGQILLSGEAAAQLWGAPRLAQRLQPMGTYHLPGISSPVDIYELPCEATSNFEFQPVGSSPDAIDPAERFDQADEERWKLIKEALRQADSAAALKHLHVLRERHPADVRVLTTLGVACAVEQQFQEAIDYLEAAVALDPRHAAGWFNLARVYGKLGKRARVGDALVRCLAADPNHPKARAVAARYGVDLPDVKE
ncbi:MAG: tetratricopeptide repeat protein [Armatimonadetes bacterium]|nr:tetratricopeptide repeat protein [Armatimonadota bacterium]